MDVQGGQTTQLVFWVERWVEEDEVEALRGWIDGLHALEWTFGPPMLVDHTDQTSDGPVRSAGCALEIYDARAGVGGKLTPEIDRREYQNASALAEAAARFARDRDLDLVVELHGEEIGSISGTGHDTSLARGLFEEWRRQIEKQSG